MSNFNSFLKCFRNQRNFLQVCYQLWESLLGEPRDVRWVRPSPDSDSFFEIGLGLTLGLVFEGLGRTRTRPDSDSLCSRVDYDHFFGDLDQITITFSKSDLRSDHRSLFQLVICDHRSLLQQVICDHFSVYFLKFFFSIFQIFLKCFQIFVFWSHLSFNICNIWVSGVHFIWILE